MLLVTTKKSTTELVKSIDFLMENNTPIFVKWLSTVIKKLQQVTVSTTEIEDLQTPKQNTSIIPHKNGQTDDILICEVPNEKLKISDEEKEELKLDFPVEENGAQQLNESKLIKYHEDDISPLLNKLNKPKQNICSFPKKDIKTLNNIQTNKKTISNTEPIKISWNNNKEINSKTKRPRITIKSDDEDDKSVRLKIPITMKETTKPITKGLPKKNKKSTSQIIVKPLKTKVSFNTYYIILMKLD
ncbi:Hypothetical protein CINCED_3A018435 [Cinara cedri]|uniref:Zinc finger CCCH domain-containing protein 14 n=1 Tax=Cinara cedri TaxID=506608 RepID=A0A5E4NCY7_9HEMI|nr:Hypothetical protein CINCED_3A018435 [Cinara cedri]